MKLIAVTSRLALLTAIVAICACKSDSVEASGGAGASTTDISPATPTFNQQFEARNPRVCSKVTHVPSAAEATVMVQCEQEAASNTGGSSPVLMLATDVSVEMGTPKPYNPGVDNYWDNIDPSSKVIPLRGSSTGFTCTPVNPYNKGKNCSKSFGGQVGQGACWHTQFNDWRCRMTIGGKNQELQVKGPTAF
jgi:hypothetical protein